MDIANGREDPQGIGSEGREAYSQGQYNTKSNLYPGARLPLRRSSRSSPVLSTETSSSEVPPVPLSPLGDATTKTHNLGPRPRTGQRSASNESYRISLSSATHMQNLRQRPSEASRLRIPSNTSVPPVTDGRHVPEVSPHEDLPSPYRSGLRGSDESPRPSIKPSSTFPLQAHDETTGRQGFPLASRDRGRSVSSSRSTATFPSMPLRTSTSIPDYGTAEPVYSRQRNFSNYSSYRPGRGFTDTGSIASYRREPNIRANGIDSDEVRASFRSALTSNSSYLGTSGTERSSVMTQTSAATSIYARDEGMSVDDAIGMYENGFDDSGADDDGPSRPDTSYSQKHSPQNPPDLRMESLALPSPPNFIIRDSAAMFRIPNGGIDGLHGTTPPADPVLTPSQGYNFKAHTLNVAEAASSRLAVHPSYSPFDETRDRYGFKKKSQHVDVAQHDSWNGRYTDYLARRRRKWEALLKESGLPTNKPTSFPPKSSKVKRFVRKGIPPEWRGAAWFYYAGGPQIVAQHHGLYSSLLQKAANGEMNPTDEELIERDLNRTFPDNIRFKPDPKNSPDFKENSRNSAHTTIEPETPILQSLRRVLQAFSIYNPRIGYCQSLNYLAGLLLLFTDDEEKSFWLLNIITREYLPGTHEVNLEGVNVDLGVLMTSVKESMPSIWAKIGSELDGSSAGGSSAGGSSRLSMRLPPITLCLSAWFMSCFIGTLPIETTLRVWDSFFYEGSKTLFRIALAIFKTGEAEIRAVNDPMEIFQVVQTIPRRLVDASALMEACFKRRNGFGHLSQETIDARRAERRRGYAEERARVAREVGEVAVHRKHTIFSRRRGKEREKAKNLEGL
jgi:TBC1 domain family member 6